MPEQQKLFDLTAANPVLLRLTATLDYADGLIRLEWFDEDARNLHATLRIRCTGLDALTWEFAKGTIAEQDESSLHRSAIRARLARLSKRFSVAEGGFTAQSRGYDNSKRARVERLELPAGYDKWVWLEGQIVVMARDSRIRFGPLGRVIQEIKRENPAALAAMEAAARHEQKKREKLAAELARRRDLQQRLRDEQRKRELARGRTARQQPSRAREQTPRKKSQPETSSTRSRLPVPAVPLTVEPPAIEFQQVFLSLLDLKSYFLREQAARWWISNQSDDLLCLPYCRIQRLEYQIRSALRVLGPLRGRALLSDEVGLGKTIEAGLVLKEYLTRGMAKRALILTVPSLVEQWEEELSDKFNLASATTNQSIVQRHELRRTRAQFVTRARRWFPLPEE